MEACKVVVGETRAASFGSCCRDADSASADYYIRHVDSLRHRSCDVILRGHQVLANLPRSYPTLLPRLENSYASTAVGLLLHLRRPCPHTTDFEAVRIVTDDDVLDDSHHRLVGTLADSSSLIAI